MQEGSPIVLHLPHVLIMSSTQGFPSNLLGSALIGAVFNAWYVLLVLIPDYFSWIRLHCGRIVGLICMQAYNYYSKFPKDRIILKLLVIYFDGP